MKVSAVVTTAIVLLVASTLVEGNGNGKKFKKVLDSKQVANLYEYKILESYDREEAKNIQFFTQQGIVNIGFDKDSTLYVFSSGALDDLDIVGDSPPINYLPYDQNKATALLLNLKRSSLFGTSRLSGCDVWIADHKDSEPLVIHVNTHDIEDRLEGLQAKQKMAFEALSLVNNKHKKEYQFVQRISFDYVKELASDDSDDKDIQKVTSGITQYWKKFADKTKIPVGLYLSNQGLFYGVYSSGAWHFTLKDINSNKHLLKLTCLQKKSTRHCTCTLL